MRQAFWITLSIIPVVIGGCADAPPPIVPPKPPVVMVALPVTKEVVDFEDFTGRTEAVASVDVRARATGYLEKIHFTDGAAVKAGQPLFEIDARPYQAEYERAEAELAQSVAAVSRLDADFRRASSLLSQRAMSREVYDKIAADRSEGEGSVGVAKAKLSLARLNLEYTSVEAPISGRASRRAVDIGNLVEANTTLLTSIVALDPMNISFDVDERTVLRLRRLTEEGPLTPAHSPGGREEGEGNESADMDQIPIRFGLADEEGFPHDGKIDFLENKVDIGTGTLRMRGVFGNPDHFYSPGLFVRVRLFVGKPHYAILVPEHAIGTDQGQKFVYVVGAKDEIQYRPIETGALVDGMRVVDKGLAAKERVVVNGLQRIRPGAKVVPKFE